jgi:hypothetical protein
VFPVGLSINEHSLEGIACVCEMPTHSDYVIIEDLDSRVCIELILMRLDYVCCRFVLTFRVRF